MGEQDVPSRQVGRRIPSRSEEPPDLSVVEAQGGLSRDPDRFGEVWQRVDELGDGDRRWHRRDVLRKRPLSWRELRVRGRVRVVTAEPEAPAESSHPVCGTCGHHTSAAVAGRCTVFVPLPEGAPAFARYCNCRCIDDPVVLQWLGERRDGLP